jgi:segregation and condensation protein B
LYKTSKEFLMRFGLSDLDELPSLKEFEALAREALGSDEGLAPSGPSDESVLDAPDSNAISTNGDAGEQGVATAPEEIVSESQSSAEEGAVESDEQAHKTAAAGE